MTGSENRGERQPRRVQLQTGPGRDAIAKSVMIGTSPPPDNYEGNVDTPYSMKSMMSTRSSKRQHAQATHAPAHCSLSHHNYYAIAVTRYSLLYVDFHYGDCRRANTTRSTFLYQLHLPYWGNQPIGAKDTSRNSWWDSLITFGEGYHNYHHYHHACPSDYRNGPRWYDFDPSKWLHR